MGGGGGGAALGSEVMNLPERRTKTANNREMHCIKPGGQEGFKERCPLGLLGLAPLPPVPAGRHASSHRHSGRMRGWDGGQRREALRDSVKT